MEIARDRTSRSASFLFVAVGLLAIATGLAAMLAITARAALAAADPPTQEMLARLAWSSDGRRAKMSSSTWRCPSNLALPKRLLAVRLASGWLPC